MPAKFIAFIEGHPDYESGSNISTWMPIPLCTECGPKFKAEHPYLFSGWRMVKDSEMATGPRYS